MLIGLLAPSSGLCRRMQIVPGELKKRRPVWRWSVSELMLAKTQISIDQRRPHGRKLARPQILLS
jgi:hypothetical protein